MQNAAVLSRAFPARISAVEALVQAIQPRIASADALRQAATELDRVGPLYGRASTADVYAAFAELLSIVALLVEWRAAVLSAEAEADRFLRGAKERYRLWLAEYEGRKPAARLVEASAGVATASSMKDVAATCRRIASTPLPIGVFADESTRLGAPTRDAAEDEATPEPPELVIAFLRFMIDGKPADETHFVTPGETHDLEIEVRASRWPERADHLKLTPVSIEPKSSYDFPVFRFPRPPGDPPFRLTERGRMVLKVPQGLQARPFEFVYRARFEPTAVEQPVAVVGQRTLRIEGIDLSRPALTGYPSIDRKLIQIRDQLRSQPLIVGSELESVLAILTPLGGLSARALQDALFNGPYSEARFQTDVRNELRRSPAIAAGLEEHARTGGGVTDLSFRGIRIELKVEDSVPLGIADCGRFADQTIAYVVATGKRVGILCVLDRSAKKSPPLPAEEGIGVLMRRTEDGAICIVTVLIQGNLARPSDLSR